MRTKKPTRKQKYPFAVRIPQNVKYTIVNQESVISQFMDFPQILRSSARFTIYIPEFDLTLNSKRNL